MKYAVDSMKMKQIDNYTTDTLPIPAMELMERAANKLVEVMQQRITTKDRILAVCGPGNNGGDGVAAARILHLQGYTVAILFVGEEEKCSDQMKTQLDMAKNLGVTFENSNKLSEYNIIIDALFGVGLSKPVKGIFEETITRINEYRNVVYAVDIPSGISADDGRKLRTAVIADETITFGHMKIGLLLYPGADHCGRITVADIGFPEEATVQVKPDTFYYDAEDISRIPERKNHSHKGSYGKVLIIAGSNGMAGAAALSAKAAYRSGAGLVKILSASCNRIIIQSQLPEALFAAYDEEGLDMDQKQQKLLADIDWATVIVIGPGLGLSRISYELLDTVIRRAEVPIVIDADAITLLAQRLEEYSRTANTDTTNSDSSISDTANSDALNSDESKSDLSEWRNRMERLSEILPEKTILTPHLMELSRLTALPVSEIANNLIDTARKCSYNNKLIYVVKDARSIVADSSRYYINVSGNHGMATGGSGDVLTGIIAALTAQGMEPYEAACLGTYIHGLAGDSAAKDKGTYSMMASDIVSSIEKVLINLDS